MTTFPSLPKSVGHSSEREGAHLERYSFQVGQKNFTLQFWPLIYLEDYSERQLAALAATFVAEVSFRLEDYTLPDGTIVAGYGGLNTGNAFQVLGGVANGIVDWARERRPAFLYWRVQDTRRQRLYEHMIRHFAARGSGWHRLPLDPFTGLHCQPDTFWLGNTSHDPVVLTRSTSLTLLPSLDPMAEPPAHRRPSSRAGQTDEDASLWRALRKRNSGIETIGIVSASNEAGRQLPEPENDRRDEALRRDLAGCGPSQVRGRFGNVDKPLLSMVNPFIVVNMARKNVVALGAKYHQFHVIFGAHEGGGEDLAMRFELVEADGAARVLAVRKLFICVHKQRLYLGAGFPDNRGRFFIIPGVDETIPSSDSPSHHHLPRVHGARE